MALATCLAAALATGCGGGRSDPWRTSTDPVKPSGVIWASGSTVHLSDGTTIEVGKAIEVFVVAGDGVFFWPDDADHGDDELLFAAPGQPVVGTGLSTDPQYVMASADGRYLTLMETATGEKDRFDTPQVTVMAFDLETGEQVVDSVLGMGDPDEDDFADGYSESEMEIQAVIGTDLYVDGMSDYVFDLTTGEGKEFKGDPFRARDPLTSPDGQWRIEQTEMNPDRIVDANGTEVALTAPPAGRHLYFWADEHTVAGTRETKSGGSVLMGCRVPSGECEAFEESAGQTVLFPVGDVDDYQLRLRDGKGS